MKSILLDTNAFLRFLLNDIPEQADIVEEIVDKAKKGKLEILVLQIIIFEIIFALEKFYNFGKNQILDKLESILTMPYLKIQDRKVFARALEIFKDNNLEFVDCFLKSKSELASIEIFTFDKGLAKLATHSTS